MKRADLLFKHYRPNLYVALENVDVDFTWDERDLPKVKSMWEKGLHIEDIARVFGRSQEDVFLLLLDLVLQDQIQARKGGIFGSVHLKKLTASKIHSIPSSENGTRVET